MMQLQICPRCNSYFDAAVYGGCPYCNKTVNGYTVPLNGNNLFPPPQPMMQQPPIQQPVIQPAIPQTVIQQPVVSQPTVQQPVMDIGKTVAYVAPETINHDDIGKTVAFQPAESINEQNRENKPVIKPVVGWLVCVFGHDRGKDYRITIGENKIGSDTDSEICLDQEEGIAKNNHASILYDTRWNACFLLPGNGRISTTCRGFMVMQPFRLSPYDVIELGKAKYIFISLCSERFMW